MTSLIPQSISLSNGSSLKIKNDGSALNFYDKYELPNELPTATNNIIVWNSDGSATFSNSLTNLQNSLNPYSNNIYVSSVSGSDSSGTGTISNSFKTLNKALQYASTFIDTIPITIMLSSGTYNENQITISRNNTSIVGSSPSNPNLTIINGSITFNITPSTSTTPVSAGISNLYVNNINHTASNNYGNSIVINNCLIVPTATFSAVSTSYSGSFINPDMTISNTLIFQYDVVALSIVSTSVSLVNCQISNNPLNVSASSFINCSGNGRIGLFGCLLTQTSSSSSVSPIINIANNINVPSPSTISSSTIQFTNTTAYANKFCIAFTNSASSNTYTLVNNILLCNSTVNNGTAGQNIAVQRSGTGNVAIIHAGNYGRAGYSFIQGTSSGFTKTSLSVSS